MHCNFSDSHAFGRITVTEDSPLIPNLILVISIFNPTTPGCVTLNQKTTKSSLWAYKWPSRNELRSQTRQHYEESDLRITPSSSSLSDLVQSKKWLGKYLKQQFKSVWSVQATAENSALPAENI